MVPELPERFVGRQAEIERLKSFAAQPKGGALLISGEAGMGKTAFVRQVLSRVAFNGQPVIHVSMARVRDWKQFYEAVAEAVKPAGAAPRLVGDDPKREAFDLLLSRQSILVVDDAITVPAGFNSELLEILGRLATAADSLKIILLARPADAEMLLSHFIGERIVLGPLDVQSQTHIVEGSNAGPWEDRFRDDMFAIAEGNPALLQIIAQDARDTEMQQFTGEVVAGMNPSQILRNTIMRVLDSLSSDAQHVLASLARFEGGSDIDELHSVSGIVDFDKFRWALREAVAKNLAYEEDDWAVFVHPLVGIVARDAFLPTDVPAKGGTLYITFDPEVVKRDDVVNLLLALNEVYRGLGGDELVIRDETVGLFVRERALLPA